MMREIRLSTMLLALNVGASTLVGVAVTAAAFWALRARAQPTTIQDPTGVITYQDGLSAEQIGPVLTGIAIPAILIAVAICAIGTWVALGSLSRPLRDAASLLSRVDSKRSLETRLSPPAFPRETRELFANVNALLEQVQVSTESGNRFAANASHELRTPLATSRTILQVALKDDVSPEVRTTLTRLLDVNDRMIAITTALLGLASAENHLSMSRVDLRAVIAEQISEVEPQIRERRVRVTLNLDDVSVNGDPQLLQQLVANLLRNAVVHNADRGILAISLSRSDGAVLAIENDGDHLSPELTRTLTEPFRRAQERTRGSGHGLGLSIAARISELHGAELSLTARPSGGVLATLRFPR